MNRDRPVSDGLHVVRGLAQRPHRTPWPSTTIWRWRWEIAGLIVAGALAWATTRAAGKPLVACLLVGACAALALPVSRAWLARRCWAIVVQHRIRVGCSEAALHGRSGRLPAVLWTRITPQGERLYLWSPSGVTISDFVTERERLAVACWASAVQARRDPRRAQIVIIDVVRRTHPDTADPIDEDDADAARRRRRALIDALDPRHDAPVPDGRSPVPSKEAPNHQQQEA